MQQIANEKSLYIVRTRSEYGNLPEIVATPERCRTEEELDPTELLDFQLHLHNGKVKEARKVYVPFYINFPSYAKAMKKRERFKHNREYKIYALGKYGDIKSFLTVREEEAFKQKLKKAMEETQQNSFLK